MAHAAQADELSTDLILGDNCAPSSSKRLTKSLSPAGFHDTPVLVDESGGYVSVRPLRPNKPQAILLLEVVKYLQPCCPVPFMGETKRGGLQD